MKPLKTLLKRVAGTISRYNMLKPGDRLGVAVSGGADSVCLLHVLHALDYPLTVVHLNHQLRGAESDGDAAFVAELAGSLCLPTIIKPIALAPGNLEQAGRNARIAVFRSLIASGAADRIATGHTRNDQAETVLYRVIRGSGTSGLSGIRPVTSDGIIRPFIDISRTEVLAFLRERDLSWREDSTNSSLQFARNRIRHELVPELRRNYNPAIVDVLAHAAAVANDEESWWAGELARLREHLPSYPDLDVAYLNELHPAVRRRLVRDAVRTVRGDLRSIRRDQIEAIVQLAASTEGTGSVVLPGRFEAWRSFGTIRIFAPRRGGAEFQERVEAPAVILLPGSTVELHLQLIEFPSVYNGDGDGLDADRLTGPLVIRNWQPGDLFRRRGHTERKLKHLLHRARVPVWERPGWPVLESGAGIVWTRKFGVAAGFEPTRDTRRVVVVTERESGQC